MRIKFIQIQNFRKLHSCQIDFSEKETIFVGATMLNKGKLTTYYDYLTDYAKH